MISLFSAWLEPLVAAHGAWAVGVLVGLESFGLPLPGETALVAAAIYAGTTGLLPIAHVLTAALIGAIVGGSLGYWTGRSLGWRFLLRHGHRIGLTQDRLRIGRRLLARYGGAVVFAGRFVAFLRMLAASLAGASGMTWPRFLLFNASGAAIWVSVFGGGGFLLGTQAHRLLGPMGLVTFGLAGVAIAAGIMLVRREEARLRTEVSVVRP